MIKTSHTCTLKPVGKAVIQNGETVFLIASQYTDALKHLSHFSHLIMFSHNGERLTHYICKAHLVDEKNGLILTDNGDIPDNTIIHDIKPYFPCEDRIPFKGKNKGRKDGQKTGTTLHDNDLNLEDLDEVLSFESKGLFRYINGKGILIMNGEYDFEESEYARVFWWFDQFEDKRFRTTLVCNPPYENAPRSGIFATRSPVRLNPIASTVVKVLGTETDRITIEGFDGFDKSVVLDIIPYDAEKENVEKAVIPEWLSHWEDHKSFRCEKAIDNHLSLELSDADKFEEKYLNQKKSRPAEANPVEIKNRDYKHITVKNAWKNNLKNINVTIPKNRITVITGVSGSGKSTLAFDTIYAESSRQFLSIMNNDNSIQKPEVDEITGLQPAVGIGQKSSAVNPRSTVGTFSGVAELLRSLFTTIGVRHCEHCHSAVEVLSEGSIVNRLKKMTDNASVQVAAHGSTETVLLKEDVEKTVKQLLKEGNGAVTVIIEDHEYLLQTKLFCYHCNTMMFDTTPAIFSANNPEYMCKTCKGLGYEMVINPEKIIENPDLSILDGASKFWGNLRKFKEKPNANWMRGEVLALADDMAVDLELPWKDLPEAYRQQVMYGTKGKKVSYSYKNSNGRMGTIEREVAGVVNTLNRLLTEGVTGERASAVVDQFVEKAPCSSCDGEKITATGRLVEINGMRYPECEKLSIQSLVKWIEDLELNEVKHERSKIIRDKIIFQANRITDMGLGYLSLDRAMPTLSGGEIRRLQLASQFGTNLSNMLYVMDEPTKGLHPKDYEKLMNKIKELRDKENTIIMVEHRNEIIRAADYIVDIGKGAGKYGGEVIACGTLSEIKQNPDSITAKYLDNVSKEHPVSTKNHKGKVIHLKGARGHNLKNITVEFPFNRFICVTGVSGSGKSSLVSQTLYPAVASRLGQKIQECLPYDELTGIENLKDIVLVSQKPIGRTPKSTPATYSGVFDLIREEFAATKEAKTHKFGKEHFSFNGKKGQCEVCNGLGQLKIPMSFMDDIWIPCHHCNGKRYREEILEVHYNGKTIYDILNTEVREAMELFRDNPKIHHILDTLNDVGLSYIKLGQSATT
nr:TrmO family methyltransferase [Thermotogota bacterium]